MSDAAAFWNPRFAKPEYLYGTQANDFLREQAGMLRAASQILSLGEGEGRNAVYLAMAGHCVSALDISEEGLKKVAALAREHQVTIQPILADLEFYDIQPQRWDAIVSSFCHLHSSYRPRVMKQIVDGLAPGGWLFMEAYTPRQLELGTGGPKEIQLLCEPDELQSELNGLEFIRCLETQRPVIEGKLHTGMASVLQIVARKPLHAITQ
jgi:SAM-dependent methyltransferase